MINTISLRKEIFQTIVDETRVIDVDLGENISLKVGFKDNMINYPVKIGVYRSMTDEYHVLGEASSDAMKITNQSLLDKISHYQKTCSKDCPPGTNRNYENLTSGLTCCWKCRTCPPNHFTEDTNQNGCNKCKIDEFSDSNSTVCLNVDIRFIETGSDIFVGGVAFFAVGIVAVILTAVLVRSNENRPVIKASEPGYLYILLVSIAIGFMGGLMALLEPSQQTCTMEYVIVVIFTTLITSNLMWKCVKISSIFAAANSFQRPKCEIFLKRIGQISILVISQVFVITFLLVDGLVTGFGWKFDNHQEDHGPIYPMCELQERYPEIICVVPLLLPLCYFLAVLFFALKMRNFPHNFRETTNILAATLIVLFCCVMFLSGYSVSPAETKALLRSIIFYITSSAFLLCLFLPKVIVLIRKTKDPEEEKRIMNESLQVFCSRASRTSPRLSVASVRSNGSHDPRSSPVPGNQRSQKRVSLNAPYGSARSRATSPTLSVGSVKRPSPGRNARVSITVDSPLSRNTARSASLPVHNFGASMRNTWNRGVEKVMSKSASVKIKTSEV